MKRDEDDDLIATELIHSKTVRLMPGWLFLVLVLAILLGLVFLVKRLLSS